MYIYEFSMKLALSGDLRLRCVCVNEFQIETINLIFCFAPELKVILTQFIKDFGLKLNFAAI